MNGKWEYLVIDFREGDEIIKQQKIKVGKNQQPPPIATQHQSVINEFGKAGWELVAVTPATGWTGQGMASHNLAYFKRLTDN